MCKHRVIDDWADVPLIYDEDMFGDIYPMVDMRPDAIVDGIRIADLAEGSILEIDPTDAGYPVHRWAKVRDNGDGASRFIALDGMLKQMELVSADAIHHRQGREQARGLG